MWGSVLGTRICCWQVQIGLLNSHLYNEFESIHPGSQSVLSAPRAPWGQAGEAGFTIQGPFLPVQASLLTALPHARSAPPHGIVVPVLCFAFHSSRHAVFVPSQLLQGLRAVSGC